MANQPPLLHPGMGSRSLPCPAAPRSPSVPLHSGTQFPAVFWAEQPSPTPIPVPSPPLGAVNPPSPQHLAHPHAPPLHSALATPGEQFGGMSASCASAAASRGALAEPRDTRRLRLPHRVGQTSVHRVRPQPHWPPACGEKPLSRDLVCPHMGRSAQGAGDRAAVSLGDESRFPQCQSRAVPSQGGFPSPQCSPAMSPLLSLLFPSFTLFTPLHT